MKKLFMSEYLNYVFQKKVWIVENIYMIKIMQLYYSSYNKKIYITHIFHRCNKKFKLSNFFVSC